MAARVLARLLAPAAPVTRYIVEGDSMEPSYSAGERVVVNRLAYLRRPPATGDVVVVRDPEQRGRLLLKRIADPPPGAAIERGRYYVLGDNAAASRDSRAFGPVKRRAVIGRAWFRY